MVDAGSAGCMTLPGLRKFIVEESQTRILALLNIACHGMAGAGCSGTDFGPGGENDHLNSTKLKPCIDAIEANRDLIVGVKVCSSHYILEFVPKYQALKKIPDFEIFLVTYLGGASKWSIWISRINHV